MSKVLVIGGGGREHAIVDALSRSPQVEKIYCAPGNAGIAEQAECVAVKDTDVEGLLAFAMQNKVDLTVVGPEAALAAGVVDAFRKEGLAIFGHTQAATRIESSKEFAKEIMVKADVPTAAYKPFTDYQEALDYVKARPLPAVIKYDGLAAGKGVVIAETLEEADAALADMLKDAAFGEGKVIIEDYLVGPEFSFMCFVDKKRVYPMPLAQDHKRAFDGDKGPNTGGMGAYTPLPFIDKKDVQFALTNILQATANAMYEAGCPLSGVLYGGLMKVEELLPNGEKTSSIKVIEFNARFGDPETEVVLPLLDTDPYEVFLRVAKSQPLPSLNWREEATIGVVLASKGYPGSYAKGAVIEGTETFNGRIYHMGTKREDGVLKTNGGRVMMCIKTAKTIQEAQQQLYAELPAIKCDNLFYRSDIAHQVM